MKKGLSAAIVAVFFLPLYCSILSENRGLKQYFIVISIDGWSDATSLPDAAHNLRELKKKGVYGVARTVFPSMTWPAHVSMITGMNPARHGIIGNRFRSAKKKRIIKAWEFPAETLIQTPTLPEILAGAGAQSASMLWPGLQGSRFIRFNLPAVYLHSEMRSSPQDFLRALERSGIPVDLLPRLAEKEDMLLDFLVRDSALFTIRKHRPQLLLIHFLSLDTMLHRLGPEDWAENRSLEFLDILIGDILHAAALNGMQPLTVFIVGDHGFQRVKKRVDIARALQRGGFRQVEYAENGQMVYFYTHALSSAEKLRFQEFLQRQSYFSHISDSTATRKKQEFAADTEIPDFTATGKSDVYFRFNSNGLIVAPALVNLGMHGGIPEKVPAAFIASGHGIAGSTAAQSISLVDLTPAILKLSGIPVPPGMDGKVPDFLKP
ncbi:MAG: alkaline phosphatase family protein [Spirochaetales bacterium]|nr:alkaline phosphatase family protein [Spirochaetales bacterium]